MQAEQAKYGEGMTTAACLWMGLFPLLHGGSYAHITRDKWQFMLLLCAATLLCFFFDLFRSRLSFRCPRLPLLLAAALLLWTVLSCIASPSGPDVWWLGLSARREGLATRLCYFLVFFCFCFSRIRLKPVLFSAGAGVCLFLAVVLLQRQNGNPFGLYPAGRSFELNPEFQGTIGNVDMDTGYLLMAAALFLCSLVPALPGLKRRENRKRLLPAAACCCAGLAVSLFLILTMGVQFGVISLGALLLFVLLRFVPKKRRLALLAVLLLLAVLAAWFWPGNGGGLWELHEILHGRARLSFGSNRVAVWLYTLGLARERPLLGGGSGTFPLRFSNYLSARGLSIPTEQDGLLLPDYFDNPHNEYLSQLADHGHPAVLLFTALLLCAVFRRRDGDWPLPSPFSAAVLCYAVQAFFSFSVCLVAPLFWMLLGLSFSDSGKTLS